MSTKTDLRVVRTRRFLWEALVRLVEERSVDDITVGEITREAMVNRTTFYRHYEGKADLLERGTAEILAELADRIRPAASASSGFESARQGLGLVLEHVAEHAEFYRIMLGSESGWRVREGIRDLVDGFLMRKVGSAEHRRGLVPDAVATRVVTSMIVGLIGWWIEERQPVSAEQLIDYYLKLAVLGPYRCLGFDPDSLPV